MAISADFAQKLSEGGGSRYFSLKNDKDFAMVRLMYNSIDEISEDIFAVHYTDDGKYECKRKNFADPITVCPLCQGGNKPKAVVFLKLYNEDSKEAQIWEKSYSWFNSSLIPSLTEMLSDNPNKNICQFPIKIVRNGAAGDMKTVYNLFCKNPDDTTLDKLGDKANNPFKDYEANAPVPEANGNSSASNDDDNLFRGM